MAMSLEKMADEKTRILDVSKGEKEKSPIAATPPEEDEVGTVEVLLGLSFFYCTHNLPVNMWHS